MRVGQPACVGGAPFGQRMHVAALPLRGVCSRPKAASTEVCVTEIEEEDTGVRRSKRRKVRE